ncbi:MAG: 3-deoxy-D-manno-octulosonic acid transferase [Gammaproteobacteria bacterium]|nr:lipid IV(A) 3-deoxy-D-manno-octulosonic acid transferase [Candidatus Thioaporhodococcus sediminis]TNF51041.1 MAG: 3-deoxy-D-manno-octulosonic acid transferase [Gammaproteobacteria bacterium]
MIRLYSLLLYLLLPIALLRLLWRGRRAPAYRRRWGERLGFYGNRPMAAGLWIHAVSVGETQAAAPLIKHFLDQHPDLGVMVTTTTPTGSERLRALFEDRVRHVYVPYDLPLILSRFLDRVRPRLVLVMETEIWPNLLRVCAGRGIPVILGNARLSAASARGYARLGAFARETFARLSLVAAQAEADAQRFIELGVPAERVRVTGSIKFDLRQPASLEDKAEAMRRLWGSDRPVWVAGSTHEGEEEPLLAAHRRIREALPQALLVLVPRHPERFDRVAALAARQGMPAVRRSSGVVCGPKEAVFLGDTMGELPVLIAAADAAFIGGSLVPVGGHNLLEAAAVGVPVAIGPHAFNFAAITRLLVEEGAAVQVADAEALIPVMIDWLSDAATRARIGEQGRQVVARNRGALERLLALVEAWLPPPA